MKNKSKLTIWKTTKPICGIGPKDKRYGKYKKQIKECGFSDTETWNLYSVISEFTLPRLKRFKEVRCTHPSCITDEKWEEVLDKMILSFELICEDGEFDQKNWKQVQEGMKLFQKYFFDLWW